MFRKSLFVLIIVVISTLFAGCAEEDWNNQSVAAPVEATIVEETEPQTVYHFYGKVSERGIHKTWYVIDIQNLTLETTRTHTTGNGSKFHKKQEIFPVDDEEILAMHPDMYCFEYEFVMDDDISPKFDAYIFFNEKKLYTVHIRDDGNIFESDYYADPAYQKN